MLFLGKLYTNESVPVDETVHVQTQIVRTSCYDEITSHRYVILVCKLIILGTISSILTEG